MMCIVAVVQPSYISVRLPRFVFSLFFMSLYIAKKIVMIILVRAGDVVVVVIVGAKIEETLIIKTAFNQVLLNYEECLIELFIRLITVV